MTETSYYIHSLLGRGCSTLVPSVILFFSTLEQFSMLQLHGYGAIPVHSCHYIVFVQTQYNLVTVANSCSCFLYNLYNYVLVSSYTNFVQMEQLQVTVCIATTIIGFIYTRHIALYI